jgi:GTP cyclohydrolase I
MEREFGLDARGPNFIDTPERVARAYSEMFSGMMENGKAVKEILSKTFPSKSSEMVTVGPIRVWSVCPHHLLGVDLKVWVAYIPNKKVLGLSKLARLAEIVAKKPALQEDTTIEIAQLLQKGLKPKGAACYIRGRHLCMEMRGVKKEALTTTTSLQGVFFKPEVRAEFLAAVRGG